METVTTPSFTARQVPVSRYGQDKRTEWAIQFVSDGTVYKTAACRAGERSGIRYASHRKGYRASQAAFKRFLAEWAETLTKLEEGRKYYATHDA